MICSACCSRRWIGCVHSSRHNRPAADQAARVVDTLLAQLIDRDLLDQEAARLRLDVSDDVIRSAIYDNPAFRGQDGRFDRALFNRF
jgi:peptidyl-prolyl cis-trans isomerase D